ncbi:hypothetical protein, partial [Chryseobacterium indoltheticum]|uniref:hypothetical protein n=1 Tax=Chryseobacterium indoltheticum TaxID=254 RepID=UPI003F493C11
CASFSFEFGCLAGRKKQNRSFRIYRETLSRFRAPLHCNVVELVCSTILLIYCTASEGNFLSLSFSKTS